VASRLNEALPTIAETPAQPAAVDALLAERGVEVVDADGWRRIDAAEIAAGLAHGQPRVKFTSVPTLLAASHAD
jgi:hypothetical protein